MTTAPNVHKALKWTSLLFVTFVCLSMVSVLDLLIFPDKYDATEKIKQVTRSRFLRRNFSNLNFSGSIPTIEDDSPNDAVNPHPFSFVLSEPMICSDYDKANRLNILTVVHTAPRHFKARAFIRETWGNRDEYPENRILFVLGLTNSSATQQELLQESRQYRDMIQENFDDTYHNLTYKAVSWLRFVSRYCPNIDYVLKADDDMVINMRHVTKFLRFHYVAGDHRTVYCLIWYNLTVQREPNNRWHLSKEDYDNDYFPNYCSGSAYILTSDIIEPLYRQSFRVPFFWIDDIYVTGLLVKRFNDEQKDAKSKIKHYDLSARYILSRKLLGDRFLQQFAMFAHVPGSVNTRHWFWDEMHKQKVMVTPRYGYIADAAMRVNP